MGGGQGGVTTQLNFDSRGEPAQLIPVAVRIKKRRFRQVHFGGYLLHPGFLSRAIQYTDGSGVPCKRPVGKGIHLDYSLAHITGKLSRTQFPVKPLDYSTFPKD